MAAVHVALLSPLTRRELRALERQLDQSHVECVLYILALKLMGRFAESVSVSLTDIDTLDLLREVRYERAARNYPPRGNSGRRSR